MSSLYGLQPASSPPIQPIAMPLTAASGASGHPGSPRLLLDQRIGDAERAAVCEELSAHYAAGRLSDEELEGRIDAAMTARTYRDVRDLLSDLPPLGRSGPVSAPVPAAPAWSGWDVIALLVFVGTVGVALVAAMAVVLGGTPGFVVVAATLTAITAGVGGVAGTHLLHRGLRRMEERAAHRAPRAGERPLTPR